jgi:hypothetical protein
MLFRGVKETGLGRLKNIIYGALMLHIAKISTSLDSSRTQPNIYVICTLINNFMNTAELYYFIGKCLAMDDDPESRRLVETEVSSGNVPWEQFVWMGSSHFVLPAIYSAFKRNALLAKLPSDLLEHLSDIYELNLHRNLQIIGQAHELIRILNGDNIDFIFLKGAGHLLQGLYHDNGSRIMSDIDILISEKDIQKAAKVLYDNGYFHPEEFKDDDFEKHHHLPGFEHSNCIAMVELHHSVLPGKYQNILSNDEIFSKKKKIEGLDAWVLSVNDQRAMNFVHDQLVDEGFSYKTMLIKGLYDFYLLSKLVPTGEIMPPVKGYERKFNTYCSIASATFNDSKAIHYTENISTRRFKRQFDYLLNNPEIYRIYQLIILYSKRVPIIMKTFIAAPFSKHSRRYIKKKAGSWSAVKGYLGNLRREL